jgi:hypothetical protein
MRLDWWINWKNNLIRFEGKVDVSTTAAVFSPENPNYYKDILVSTSFIYWIGTMATWTFLFIYLFLRMGRGKCGGYRSRKP